MKLNIFLIRHGETFFNKFKRVQGWSDSPLTKKGLDQSRKIAEYFLVNGFKLEAVFSSDSGRAIETASTIVEELKIKIPHTKDRRLREWCFGSFEGQNYDLFVKKLLNDSFDVYGKNREQLLYPEISEILTRMDTEKWTESWEDLRERIFQSIFEIAEKSSRKGGKNILIVGHSLSISTFLWLIDNSQPKFNDIKSGTITQITFENEKFELVNREITLI